MEDFELEWVRLRERLARHLATFNVPSDVAEDAIQETAIRLLRHWRTLDTSTSLWPLVRTIGTNLVRDRYRNDRRWREIVANEIPDTPADYDVEAAGIARFELSLVLKAVRRLKASDAALLMAEVGNSNGIDPQHHGLPAVKMRRSRARRRLQAQMRTVRGGIVGLPVTLRLRFRRFNETIARYVTSTGELAASALAVAMAIAVASAAGLQGMEGGEIALPDVRNLTTHSGRTPAHRGGINVGLVAQTHERGTRKWSSAQRGDLLPSVEDLQEAHGRASTLGGWVNEKGAHLQGGSAEYRVGSHRIRYRSEAGYRIPSCMRRPRTGELGGDPVGCARRTRTYAHAHVGIGSKRYDVDH